MDWPPIAGDPRFFDRSGPYSLKAVADAAQAKAPPGNLTLTGVGPLQTAGPGDVSFLDNRKYAAALAETRAGAVIVHPDMADRVPPTAIAIAAGPTLPGHALPHCSIQCRWCSLACTRLPLWLPTLRSIQALRLGRWP
jgi:UDP-3-O-[3-hydroxymyristoyl] glucosamine N-acyltransferase, LpxD